MDDSGEKIVDSEKVMDVSSPGEAMPSPTKRPVIVTNRSMVNADPMVAPLSTPTTDVASDSVPQADPVSPVPETSQEEKGCQLGTDTEVVASSPTEPVDASEDAKTKSQPSTRKEKVLTPLPSVDSDPIDSTSDVDTDSQQTSATPQTDDGDNEAVQDLRQKYQGEKVPDSDIEAAAREAELMEIVERGTYKLPLGQRRKHTERAIIAVFVLSLIALLVINILLDLGTLELPGVPHTDFIR